MNEPTVKRASHTGCADGAEGVICHREVITSTHYARSRWGDRAEWCDQCNGWVQR